MVIDGADEGGEQDGEDKLGFSRRAVCGLHGYPGVEGSTGVPPGTLKITTFSRVTAGTPTGRATSRLDGVIGKSVVR